MTREIGTNELNWNTSQYCRRLQRKIYENSILKCHIHDMHTKLTIVQLQQYTELEFSVNNLLSVMEKQKKKNMIAENLSDKSLN